MSITTANDNETANNSAANTAVTNEVANNQTATAPATPTTPEKEKISMWTTMKLGVTNCYARTVTESKNTKETIKIKQRQLRIINRKKEFGVQYMDLMAKEDVTEEELKACVEIAMDDIAKLQAKMEKFQGYIETNKRTLEEKLTQQQTHTTPTVEVTDTAVEVEAVETPVAEEITGDETPAVEATATIPSLTEDAAANDTETETPTTATESEDEAKKETEETDKENKAPAKEEEKAGEEKKPTPSAETKPLHPSPSAPMEDLD